MGDSRAVSTVAADLLLNRWVADYPDPDAFAYGLLDMNGGMVSHFCSTLEIDQLIVKGRTETDPKVRHPIYRKMEEEISTKGLLLPLFHEQSYRFARPEIEGMEVGFSFPTVAYEKIWVTS